MAEKPTVRCPHCKTSFHIHAEHLAIAKGVGRCGSCLQIFNIADQLPSNNTPQDIIKSEQLTGSSNLDDQDSLFDDFFDKLSQDENANKEGDVVDIKDEALDTTESLTDTTIDSTIDSPIDSLLDTPIEEEQKPQKNYTPFWLTLSFMMILVMLAQIIYFKFDTLSQDPNYRPIYSIICQIVDCQLPELQDVSQISTQHFTVRQHPSIAQALSIDTLLINDSPHQQSFPDLKISFTDAENQVVASRSFKPKEYLAGELTGETTMPSQVPIHIALEIINPSDSAMNYQIELVSNY